MRESRRVGSVDASKPADASSGRADADGIGKLVRLAI
jgi:hypothetical protein